MFLATFFGVGPFYSCTDFLKFHLETFLLSLCDDTSFFHSIAQVFENLLGSSSEGAAGFYRISPLSKYSTELPKVGIYGHLETPITAGAGSNLCVALPSVYLPILHPSREPRCF